MRKRDRLFDIIAILRDGNRHRAEDIAQRLSVSVRTIYRDMETLAARGVPVTGARGMGYQTAEQIALPPLALRPDELEALNLAVAIVAETTDPALRDAANRLAAKIDAVLPERAVSDSEAWKIALHPQADTARGSSHIPIIRAAIRGRQKLALRALDRDGALSQHRVRPLQLESFGRVWTLTAWSETAAAFRDFRLDLIEAAQALPELFADEPGHRLEDREQAEPVSPRRPA